MNKQQPIFDTMNTIGAPIAWRNTGDSCEGNNLTDEFMCIDNFVGMRNSALY